MEARVRAGRPVAGIKFINKYLFWGLGFETGVWLETISDFMHAHNPSYREKGEASSSVEAHVCTIQ